jgi:hypothetical protein
MNSEGEVIKEIALGILFVLAVGIGSIFFVWFIKVLFHMG